TSEGSSGGSFLPADLPQIKVPVPGTFSLPAEIPNPIVIRPPEVEFAITVDKSKIVSIYRVDYIDTNGDGQPGMDELPSKSSVLESIKKPQVKDDGFEITSVSDGTPTQQEIDAKKAELIRDPQRPSGAYAIVEKDPDGKESVIEVFPIRDWEDEAPKNSSDLPLVPSKAESADEPGAEDLVIPRPMPEDSSSDVAPPNQKNEGPLVASTVLTSVDPELTGLRGNSRFASLGLFFGSLWIVRETTKKEKTSTDEVLEELGSIGFSSRDRRNRRLQSNMNY
ncbi:MAG TPA: hypothetical protein VM260_03495, partial [Pirellula sp.]|nr:hypothetical protein [Pirellula sp.]